MCSARAFGGMVQAKGSRALQQLDCVARTKHQGTVFWVSSYAKKLSQSDRVRQDYSKSKVGRFLRHRVTVT